MNAKTNNGFGKLAVRGFRRLDNIEIDFTSRSLAVIVGANGVGKTSLLETFGLLAAAASGKLRASLSQSGGLSEILTRGRRDSLAISIGTAKSSDASRSPLNYELELTLRGIGYEIVHEALTEQQIPDARQTFKYIDSLGTNVRYYEPSSKKLVRPTWQHDPFETSLAQVPKMYERPEEFRHELASFGSYAVLNVGLNSPIRLPQPLSPTLIPKPGGEETVTALYQMRETQPHRFETLKDTLKAVFPEFEDIRFPSVAAGNISLNWQESSYEQPFNISELSEGTVRFLWLCTLLLSTDLPNVVVIDEPEVSLHPAMLLMLAHLLRDAARRSQVIVATHSERLISYLRPEEILVADCSEGNAEFAWADKKEDLSQWLKDYTLGELWAMNIFGGRS